MLTELLHSRKHLLERARSLNHGKLRSEADFVLYWMHVAVRAHENPSLDTAVAIANQLGKPLLVYHALSERYEYASDRHHTFILQGAADAERQFADRGIPYVFHLERHGHRGPWLKQLAGSACLVVTDEMPVNPMSSWVQKLAACSQIPVIAVDASCIVPMQVAGRSFLRAFEYRTATKAEYDVRVTRPWQDECLIHTDAPATCLPFTPIDFAAQKIPELVARCDIDHLIGPVPETIGGSAAGYERWENFKGRDLKGYAKRRNDPLKNGVSRMSAYLHYGMVSPFRLAREAAGDGSPGAEKYLDELLIWRELSWAYCFHSKDPNRLDAIPDWAIRTLREHEADRREVLHDWETLARASTGNSLWNAAQQSLLIHGELHNNVRMTWGKALLQWTSNAQEALDQIIDLNHRYALDGRDPSSYGGILWCLGQFDRPFRPPQPIIGTVRPRPLQQHAQRLNINSYQSITSRSLTGPNHRPERVAVIGAGLAGLICARTLQDHGLDVTVFDKGRKPAGRMSTRETRTGFHFDHGCQYFKATDARFRRYVDAWEKQGIVARWTSPIVRLAGQQVHPVNLTDTRFVGVPGMNAVCQHLSEKVVVKCGLRISRVHFDGEWTLSDEDSQEHSGFDQLVIAIPAGQARDLLPDRIDLGVRLQDCEMKKSWTTLVTFSSQLSWPYHAAIVEDNLLGWVCRDSSKPGRLEAGGEQCWVLQANSEWSDQHFNNDPDEIAGTMLSAFQTLIGEAIPEHLYLRARRWKFALAEARSVAVPTVDHSLYDSENSVVVCGDWCCGHNIQAAFLSGCAAAGRILGSLEYTAAKPTTLF